MATDTNESQPIVEKDGTKILDALPFENNVEKDYVPEGFETVEDFLTDMREEYDLDIAFDKDNRDEALDDKRFVAGEQWDPIVLEQRRGLPTLTINTIPAFVEQIVGDWRSNRNAIKVVPVEDADVDIATIRGDLIRSIEAQSRAQRVYSNAFESMIQCGEGAFRVSVEYARDDVFDQDIFIRPIDDALSVVWDRLSTDPTGRDARHVFVDDILPEKEFNRKWPEESPSELNEEQHAVLRAGGWCTDAGVRVTEYWRMLERPRLLVLFEDGSIIPVDEEEDYAKLVTIHGNPQRSRVAPCLYAQMHLVTGHAILSGPYEYRITRVPIIRMVGRVTNIAGRRVRTGVVRLVKDAVRLRNFHRSVAAEQLGYAPKAQWIGPESAFEGLENRFRNAHMSRDPILKYNDDAISPPERLDPPPVQMALLNEAQVNTQDIKDITGIHDASLGIRSNETSGKAIMARQREGDITNLVFHDNGNASLLEAGDVSNQLIGQIYDGTRTLRIVGEDEEVRLIRINDPMDPNSPNLAVGKYDTVLSTGLSYTTRRVEAAEAMLNTIQVYPELMQVAGDLIVKAQDWPGADKLAERLKKVIPPHLLEENEQQIDPAQVQAQMAQMQAAMQALQMENQTLQDERLVKERELEIKAYEAETKRIGVLSDKEVDATELNYRAIEMILNGQDKDSVYPAERRASASPSQ